MTPMQLAQQPCEHGMKYRGTGRACGYCLAFADLQAIDDRALEAARMAVEDALVEWRDNTRFTICGNGFTIRNRDGSPSSIVRFRTDWGLRIALRTYLEALSR